MVILDESGADGTVLAIYLIWIVYIPVCTTFDQKTSKVNDRKHDAFALLLKVMILYFIEIIISANAF